MKKYLRNVITSPHFLPILALHLFVLIIFRKYIFDGQIPIPADILVGAYYPWLESSWGYPVSVPVKNPLPSDVVSLIYPWRFIGINMIKEGIVPLWDNTILLGAPLLANFQSAILNPFNVLFLALPFLDAWGLQVVLQILILFLFSYLFFSNLGMSRASSTFGSLVFTFSGYTLVWLEYNSIIYAVSYFPLLLFSIDKVISHPKIIWSLLIGSAIALQVVSGYPLVAIYSLFFAFIYFIWRLVTEKTDPSNLTSIIILLKTRKILLFLLGIFTGIGFSAVQLVPSLELQSLSIRSFDMTAQAGGIKYLSIPSIISFFAPDFFGNPATANYWGTGSYDNFAFFAPVAGIFFFLISIVGRRSFSKKYLIFPIFILISIIYATENTVSNFLSNSILGSSVNTRVLFVATFAVSAMSAVGLDEFLDKKTTLLQKLTPLSLYGMLTFSVIFSRIFLTKLVDRLSLIDIWSTWMSEDVRLGIVFLKEEFVLLEQNLYIALRNLAIPSLIILVITVVILIQNKRNITIPLLIFAILLSTRVSYDKYLSFTPHELVFPEVESLTVLKDLSDNHRFEREKAEIITSNTWSPYGLKSPSGQNASGLLSTARYINLINTSSQKDEILTRYQEVNNIRSPLFDTLDVKYYLAINRNEKESIPDKSGRPFPWIIPDDFIEVENISSVRIYENTNNLGTAWFPEETVCESDRNEVSQFLIDEKYDPRKTIYVDCGDNVLAKAEFSKIENLRINSPNHIQIDTVSEIDRYLIISHSNYPGWKVYVDDTEGKILTANGVLMSVLVPAGFHSLDLVYDPSSVKIGFWISVFTAIIWVIYVLRCKLWTNKR